MRRFARSQRRRTVKSVGSEDRSRRLGPSFCGERAPTSTRTATPRANRLLVNYRSGIISRRHGSMTLTVLPPKVAKAGASMDWNRLLSTTRVKGLFGQSSSVPISGDLRSEFDRDYGRTVFSTPVRRLQDKAQVFPLERHDAVRTRLTHSMEVSSVARSLGDTAERFLFSYGDLKLDKQRGTLGTIAATCGLIHDLGNPPFGHSGEASIREWLRKLSTRRVLSSWAVLNRSLTLRTWEP